MIDLTCQALAGYQEVGSQMVQVEQTCALNILDGFLKVFFKGVFFGFFFTLYTFMMVKNVLMRCCFQHSAQPASQMIHKMIQVSASPHFSRFISEISGLELIFYCRGWGYQWFPADPNPMFKAPGSQSASGSSKVAAGTAIGLLGASECLACLEDHFGAALEHMTVIIESSLDHVAEVDVVDICDK